MRDAGLELAIKAAGGVGSLARGLGIAQPSVSAWSRIPAERVLAAYHKAGGGHDRDPALAERRPGPNVSQAPAPYSGEPNL